MVSIITFKRKSSPLRAAFLLLFFRNREIKFVYIRILKEETLLNRECRESRDCRGCRAGVPLTRHELYMGLCTGGEINH